MRNQRRHVSFRERAAGLRTKRSIVYLKEDRTIPPIPESEWLGMSQDRAASWNSRLAKMETRISLHIALGIPALGGGGAERSVLRLAHGLIRRGHAVDILVFGKSDTLANEVPDGARIFVMDRGRYQYDFGPYEFAATLRIENIQVSSETIATRCTIRGRIYRRRTTRLHHSVTPCTQVCDIAGAFLLQIQTCRNPGSA